MGAQGSLKRWLRRGIDTLSSNGGGSIKCTLSLLDERLPASLAETFSSMLSCFRPTGHQSRWRQNKGPLSCKERARAGTQLEEELPAAAMLVTHCSLIGSPSSCGSQRQERCASGANCGQRRIVDNIVSLLACLPEQIRRCKRFIIFPNCYA